ncbi:SAM-dependent chlorinase/fluorinase [Rubrivirga sp. S365]|uniref:SAM hydrolase/SAM-dependent halogenase family protein n=1 Tax=Rubrivirga sp. S365 TaxID=3076080 RepID=UPI0028C62468|nr:SAM-dependent chlorinase/fluorinase [Rubrivirga sp. S365]MDT7856892.1 SAM-dependent chlorinase/fluorinase [Rubrivirga sp. S365]
MIVTLTTDFGLRDGYVAAMKGAMLAAAPDVRAVDVTHEVPAQDVMAAAFVLRGAAPFFPAGTVHLAVVDPGVGTLRRAIAARLVVGGTPCRFVGPDNGLLPLLADGPPVEAVVLDRPGAWRTPVPSDTLHGRDVFGPVAAALAAGAALDDIGSPAGPLAPLHWPLPRVDAEGVEGMVLHVDRFGNCTTNIPREALAGRGGFKAYVGSSVLRRHAPSYGHVAAGEPLTLFGSSGHLEIAVNRGDAAALLSVVRGAPVSVVFEAAPAPPPRTRTRSASAA